jgi:hypothetical protein
MHYYLHDTFVESVIHLLCSPLASLIRVQGVRECFRVLAAETLRCFSCTQLSELPYLPFDTERYPTIALKTQSSYFQTGRQASKSEVIIQALVANVSNEVYVVGAGSSYHTSVHIAICDANMVDPSNLTSRRELPSVPEDSKTSAALTDEQGIAIMYTLTSFALIEWVDHKVGISQRFDAPSQIEANALE